MRKSASDPIGTLSVGNVINAAVSLYKANFRDFFTLALRSVGWMVLAIVGLIPVVAVGFAVNNAGVTVLAVVAWLGLFIFCLAKSMTSRGVVSRLAYQQLINQPESLLSASSELANSHWRFLGLVLWLWLFLTGVFILSYLALGALVGVGVAIAMNIQNPIGYLLTGIFVIAGIVAFFWIFLRFYSSWFVAELPIAVERCSSGLDAIGRSRQLSAPFLSRILMVILVAFLIVIPLNIITTIPAVASVGQEPTSAVYIISQVVNLVLSILLELFLMPFWQVIKSVVYFDLRSRLEGADLQMR
jgi:hypothetical protein